GPGAMALTRTLNGASSRAAVLTRPQTACLLAIYGAIIGEPITPAIDESAMIDPEPRFLIGSTQCFIDSHTPMTLVRRTFSNSATDKPSIGAKLPSVPAFATSMSTPPKASIVAA